MKQFPRIAKHLIAFLLVIYATSSAPIARAACPGTPDGREDDTQLQSLTSIYYQCGKLPPDPTPDEIYALAASKIKPELKTEADFLDAAFPGNLKLQVWAGRDHDADGIIDFRVSKSGEFRENDTDVDCDGIANVLDDEPYGTVDGTDSSICLKEPARKAISNDQNGNGIPDQLDWRLIDVASDEARPADIQEGLLRDYGILLVDRRAKVSAAMANELDHIIRKVYKGQIGPDHAALRVIAADTDVCGTGNWAWASAHSSTLFIYPSTLALSPLLRAEVLVHEIAHTLQFARDYTPGHLFWLRSWNGWQTENFHSFAKTLGWEPVRDYSQKSYSYYQLVVPNCASGKASNHYPFNWTFKGEPAKTWQETWDFYKTNGNQPVSTNPELKKRHMVGRYAYTDAWEWHAEYTAAYALNRIVEAADLFCSASQQDALKSWLHSAMDENGWNFNHENAQGLDVYENQIASQFDVTDETWAELSRYFVRASHPQICGLQPLPGSPEIAGD